MLTIKHDLPKVAWSEWRDTLGPAPLVVTTLRHPHQRCVSALDHVHIDAAVPPSMQEKMRWLRRDCNRSNFSYADVCCGNFQYHFLSLWPSEPVDHLLARYDFIFITERFDDSLLAFRSQWNLTFAQLLHVRLKSSDRRQVCAFRSRKGFVVKKENGEALTKAKTDRRFLGSNWADLYLWQEANARLDNLLSGYGSEQLERDREMLQIVLKVARDTCQRLSAELCIDCLHEDIGCAQDCLDLVAEKIRVFVGDT